MCIAFSFVFQNAALQPRVVSVSGLSKRREHQEISRAARVLSTMIRSGRAAAANYRGNGSGEDCHIQEERPFVDVLEVQRDPVVKIGIAASINLPKAREPRFH